MKKLLFVVSLLCVGYGSDGSVGFSHSLKERPDLKKLGKESFVEVRNFIYPFVISQAAISVPFSRELAAKKVRAYLAKERLSVVGHLEDKGLDFTKINASTVKLPSYVIEKDQPKHIEKCKRNNCLIKLHVTSEARLVEKASKEEKLKVFQEIIISRMRSYIKDRYLKGYESRLDNVNYFQKAFKLLGFLQSEYPISYKFMVRSFWEGLPAPEELKDTFIKQQKLTFSFEKKLPVWRIGEVFEFNEKDRILFIEVHIYSSHFLDSSLVVFEVVPRGKKSALIMTDVMEFDLLKKNSFSRIVYTPKMQQVVSTYQRSELEKIK